jgi:hypothetical protein
MLERIIAGQFRKQITPQAVDDGISSIPRAFCRQKRSKRSRIIVMVSMTAGRAIFQTILRARLLVATIVFDTGWRAGVVDLQRGLFLW